MSAGSTMLMSAQSDIPMGGYDCFGILGQIYIVKVAIFDQFCQHRKELSWSENGSSFGSGMAWGPRWEHVEVATVQSARLRIGLLMDGWMGWSRE